MKNIHNIKDKIDVNLIQNAFYYDFQGFKIV